MRRPARRQEARKLTFHLLTEACKAEDASDGDEGDERRKKPVFQVQPDDQRHREHERVLLKPLHLRIAPHCVSAHVITVAGEFRSGDGNLTVPGYSKPLEISAIDGGDRRNTPEPGGTGME